MMIVYTTITKNRKYIDSAANLKNSLNNKKLITEYYFPKDNSFEQLNLGKLKKWYNFLIDSKYKDILFLDSDTLIVEDVEYVFKEDFDIAYTMNPLNSGVIFCKSNKRVTDFFKTWIDISEEMLTNKKLYHLYSKKYPGFIQTSFGYLLENCTTSIKLRALESSMYNASTKENYNKQKFKILHLRPEVKKLKYEHTR